MGGKAGFFVCVLLVSLAYLLEEVSSDSFLINCGSHNNITIGDRVFLGENYATRYLVTPVNILADSSINTTLPLYKTARIFNRATSYTFPIKHVGRYFIRFHFFPFTSQAYNLSIAKFDVSAFHFMLLNNFTPPISETTKEYSINVTSNLLEITLAPSSSSVGFLNALEVFLVPDALIKDDATLITPAKTYIGLPDAALETVFRVNMGGSTVDSTNDTLWRTWENDDSFLETKGSSVEVQNMPVVHYRSGLSTRDFAPTEVYGTCRRLSSQKNNNITWKFTVDWTFQYLVRFHFCDIVSSSRNKRSFNMYINSRLASRQLNLTSLDHGFWGAPVYTDFVTEMFTGDEFTLSIDPALIDGHKYDAILNGLEIMKISNVYSSLAMVPSVPSSKQESYNHHIGTLVLAIVGMACVVVLAILAVISSCL